MLDYLEHMKALNLQKRTVAILENGSWAVKSGDLMQQFIDDNLKNMTVLNERISMASTLKADKKIEVVNTAQAIIDSMQEAAQ